MIAALYVETDGARQTISRAQAKAAGLTRYFTGKPCKHGHISEREFPNNFTATLYSAHALKRDEYLDAAIDALRLSPPADEQGGEG